ncbi:MAG: hypothetical protein A2X35_02915 [Elusimicrobia bacterium GWA2_61_42]|nr:MAG: hypothetical protein A2X35_02915 [Elusimicrobia bacterium GWA2_61_42]OGR74808.1 MAG: hypothetical protein A2X38_08580 [Elusimicrobia bacterium GWC2_61_25]
MKKIAFWVLSFLITLSFAVFQRMTGPTYPVKGGAVDGTGISGYRLPRSCTTGGDDCRVRVNYKGPLQGRVEWRRYRTTDAVQVSPLEFKDGLLFFLLPSQPPAGKLEYRVFVEHPSGERELSPGPVVTRFKGPVPAWALTPHIIFIFLFMFFSVRIAFTALVEQTPLKHAVVINLAFLLLGGFLFGPLVQYYAFGQAWTGFPFGYDLTDNKTLLMLLAWLPALWSVLKDRPARRRVLLAFAVTAAVYLVPHSMFGSELDYASNQVVTGGK